MAGHFHKALPAEHPGYFGRLAAAQHLSAVTAACLLTSRSAWKEVGGLDAERLPVAFNDVDYCLKLREAGYHVVWTPEAFACHHESATRGNEDSPAKKLRFHSEARYMETRWAEVLKTGDPFYSPNLTIAREDLGLAFPPRAPNPWQPRTGAQARKRKAAA